MSIRELEYRTVSVNGEIVPICNPVSYKRGLAKVNVHTSTVGDSNTHSHSLDNTDAKGMITITVRVTNTIHEQILNWQNNIGKNAVKIMDEPNGSFLVLNDASIEEDLEIEAGAELKVMFTGGQIL